MFDSIHFISSVILHCVSPTQVMVILPLLNSDNYFPQATLPNQTVTVFTDNANTFIVIPLHLKDGVNT